MHCGDASGMTVVLDEPRLVADAPGAPDLHVTEGAIDFEDLSFGYTDGGVKTMVFNGFVLSFSSKDHYEKMSQSPMVISFFIVLLSSLRWLSL